MLVPDLRTIEISESFIVITFEAEGLQQRRIVHMDRAAHSEGLAPSIVGHSIGRWDGDTLVIDTVGIAPHRTGSFVVPSTASTHIVERLTMTPDRR